MAYEMLSGAPPFTGTPQAVIDGAHADATAAAAGRRSAGHRGDRDAVPRQGSRCRYQSADELLTAIDALVTPGGTAWSRGRCRRRRRRKIALAVVAVAAVGATAFFGIRRMQRNSLGAGTAIPEMRRMIEDGQMDSAWYVGLRARRSRRATPPSRRCSPS